MISAVVREIEDCEDDERELRKIEFRKKRGADTWEDYRRSQEIHRRLVDAEFERQERANPRHR